jgi:hypothetical protein
MIPAPLLQADLLASEVGITRCGCFLRTKGDSQILRSDGQFKPATDRLAFVFSLNVVVLFVCREKVGKSSSKSRVFLPSKLFATSADRQQ